MGYRRRVSGADHTALSARLPLIGERRRSKSVGPVYDAVIPIAPKNPAYRPRHLWAGGARHYRVSHANDAHRSRIQPAAEHQAERQAGAQLDPTGRAAAGTFGEPVSGCYDGGGASMVTGRHALLHKRKDRYGASDKPARLEASSALGPCRSARRQRCRTVGRRVESMAECCQAADIKHQTNTEEKGLSSYPPRQPLTQWITFNVEPIPELSTGTKCSTVEHLEIVDNFEHGLSTDFRCLPGKHVDNLRCSPCEHLAHLAKPAANITLIAKNGRGGDTAHPVRHVELLPRAPYRYRKCNSATKSRGPR
jgi:hypothetical protein